MCNYKEIIFILLNIHLIKTQCTTGSIVLNSQINSCFKNSVPDGLCCAITTSLSLKDNSMCFQIKKADFKGQSKVTYNGDSYFLDCGEESVINLLNNKEMTRCGPFMPMNEEDCWKYKNNDNSCCVYQSEGIKGCSWAGMKYKGKLDISLKNLTVSCKGVYIFDVVRTYLFIFLFAILI